MQHIRTLLLATASLYRQPHNTQEARRVQARRALGLMLLLSAVLLLQVTLVPLHSTANDNPPSFFVPPRILRTLGIVRSMIEQHIQQEGGRDVYRLFQQNARLCRVSTRCSPEELEAIVNDLSPLVAQPRNIYNELAKNRQPRRCILSTANRITMVLVWMAHYDVLERLAGEFGVSAQIVFLDIYHILPCIIARFRYTIQWPGPAERQALEGCILNFDGAVGYLNGSHSAVNKPGGASEDWESEFWCTHGTERTHTMAAQVTVNYHGIPIHACFGLLGAGNDQGNFWLSTLPRLPLSAGQYLISDAEYQHFARILAPYHANGRLSLSPQIQLNLTNLYRGTRPSRPHSAQPTNP